MIVTLLPKVEKKVGWFHFFHKYDLTTENKLIHQILRFLPSGSVVSATSEQNDQARRHNPALHTSWENIHI